MAECIFCGIVEGRVPATVLAEDDQVLAFEDVAPQAPVHLLVVPRRHLRDARELEDAALLQRLFETAHAMARHKGVADTGYRLVFNIGRDAGQGVDHVHLHVLGGRDLKWPPG
jgi:histidine triad (HIT) family protein